MTTIARKIIATPVRSTSQTWGIIIDLLAPETDGMAREELLAISGIACSLIADETMKKTPIVVHGSGPRVRIYCLYDEDAVSGENAREDALSFNATQGDWHMSLPCQSEDLSWVKTALKKLSNRVTVRDMTTDADSNKAHDGENFKAAVIDKEAFLRP